MASYVITGKLGSGKGLISVAKALAYIEQGRKVASNTDIFLGAYFSPMSKRTYIAKRFYPCYNTKQVFTSMYPHGAHSVLSPWHIKGRYMGEKKTLKQRVNDWLNANHNPIPLKPKNPLVERIQRLPCPKQREQFMRRFEQTGAFTKYA